MILLGVVAIASPFIATISVGLLLGCLFVLGGILQAAYAFQNNRKNSRFIKILLSLLSLIAGIILVANPLAGMVSLTLALGIFYFIDGVFRIILAFQLKSASRWSIILFNGVLMTVLGVLIWSQWPSNAAWILGTLVGVGLIVNGVTMLFFRATDHWSRI